VYILTRDDGTELRLNGGLWESALELAYVNGWRPAGTHPPSTDSWRTRQASPGARDWDRQDYFSLESQHVERADARAIADAVLRALMLSQSAVPEGAGEAPAPEQVDPEALHGHRRDQMRRLAAFAGCGGFTIAGAG
jgi:hypothetical protein